MLMIKLETITERIKRAAELCGQDAQIKSVFNRITGCFAGVKSEEAEPVKYAEWVQDDDGDWKCSGCGAAWVFDESEEIHPIADLEFFRCPNCGAHMKGGNADGYAGG